MMTNQIAATILEQLGGRRFLLMTGTKNLVAAERALIFDLPKCFAKDGINKIRIELELNDTYTLTFFRLARRGLEVTTVAERELVYAEDLRRVFTSITGLDTRL
jgi:hypothetical protein